MTITRKLQIINVILVILVLVALIASTAAVALFAQEKPAKPTRDWNLGWLPRIITPGILPIVQEVRIHVFDTEGVCLYVARVANNVALTSVSKKDLPSGAKCQ